MTPEELATIKTRCDSTSLSLIGRDLPNHPDAPFVEHARNDVTALLEEVERLRESEDEYAVLCDRLSELLTQTAEALKGPPPPLTMHDWSDLPAVAARLVDHHQQAHHHGMLP